MAQVPMPGLIQLCLRCSSLEGAYSQFLIQSATSDPIRNLQPQRIHMPLAKLP